MWNNTAVRTAVLGELGVKATFSMSRTVVNIKPQVTARELQSTGFQWASDRAKGLSVPALLRHSHQILHNSHWKGSSSGTRLSEQNGVGLRKSKPQTSPLLSALPILERLKWQHKWGAWVFAVTPQLFGFVLSISDMEYPAGPQCGWLFPVLFVPWALCPELFYSSPWLSLPPFSDFKISQCLYCAAHLPWLWLWWCAQIHLQAQCCGFSLLPAVCLKAPFSPPSCVSVALLLSAVLLRPLHQWHRLLLISRLVKICSHASCHQELDSKCSRGINTGILWTSCFISPKERGSNGMCKFENWSSLGSGASSDAPRLLFQEQFAAHNRF